MKRSLITLAVVTALALPLATPAPAGPSATRLAGTTGPSFTITLKRAGQNVRTLRPGKYTFVVRDRSAAHDFWLVGPGVRNRQITGLGFTGTRTVTVTLRKGRYEYYCKPHRRMGMSKFVTVR